jgi:alpha-tubulin suppressor-like RCC1 family protein
MRWSIHSLRHGEAGELFSWGRGMEVFLGHGGARDEASPKRVEALRGVRISSVSIGMGHVLALAEDGLVYVWGEHMYRALSGNPDTGMELPKPVEALRGVRVGSIAAADVRSYALADTGELWAWGIERPPFPPLGHGEQNMPCFLPKPIAPLQGVKVDAVAAAAAAHTLAVADDGIVYAWGGLRAAERGALGLDHSVSEARTSVPTPQRIPALRVAVCGL